MDKKLNICMNQNSPVISMKYYMVGMFEEYAQRDSWNFCFHLFAWLFTSTKNLKNNSYRTSVSYWVLLDSIVFIIFIMYISSSSVRKYCVWKTGSSSLAAFFVSSGLLKIHYRGNIYKILCISFNLLTIVFSHKNHIICLIL